MFKLLIGQSRDAECVLYEGDAGVKFGHAEAGLDWSTKFDEQAPKWSGGYECLRNFPVG